MKRAVTLLAALALASPPALAQDAGDAQDVGDAGDAEAPLAPPTNEKTKTPTAPEWTQAVRVKPTRRSKAAAGCRVSAFKDWVRVRCPVDTFAISLVGGQGDVSFWIDPKTKEGEVQMPIRPGSRHIVQFWTAGKDAAGAFTPVASIVVQQHWATGAATPVLTLF